MSGQGATPARIAIATMGIVLLAWIWDERKRRGLRRAWAPALATVLVGVSAGLPLLLLLRGEENRS